MTRSVLTWGKDHFARNAIICPILRIFNDWSLEKLCSLRFAVPLQILLYFWVSWKSRIWSLIISILRFLQNGAIKLCLAEKGQEEKSRRNDERLQMFSYFLRFSLSEKNFPFDLTVWPSVVDVKDFIMLSFCVLFNWTILSLIHHHAWKLSSLHVRIS